MHSALIDELIERFPRSKPVLGMPKQKLEWFTPSEGLSLFSIGIEGDPSGSVFIATSQEFQSRCKLGPDELWEGVEKRAGSELMRRKVQPRFSGKGKTESTDQTLTGLAKMIWIPFEVEGASLFLGIGVFRPKPL
jgi:hypothetical protein